MPEKYPYICPDCGKQYELTIPIPHPKCWKCGAELVVEDEQRSNAEGGDSAREEKTNPAKESGRTNAADEGADRGGNTQPVYTCEKERGSQMRITNRNSGDDCAWANAVKAMGWVAVVVASLYGFIGAGIGGLIVGLLASMLAVSGIMMIADMAKDIRRIRMMMEEDQIDR